MGIGRYRIEEEIGQGGMGTVYRAIDTVTDSHVAIKYLKSELIANSPDIVDRFVREGEALRQLNHPNIVKMLDSFQDGDNHYLVMEYVSGGSLAELLRREQALSVSRTLDIALELTDALTRAHHLRIIHRDIKPANVLIADDGTPRLTDFGVARIGKAQRITEAGVAVGTLHYLSPEALNGEEIDARTDLWGFGVMLFEMLVGKLPFDSNQVGSIITSILLQPVPDLEMLRPDLPVALIDLINRMLEKDRQMRIPSARLVGAELEAIQQGRDTPSIGVKRSLFDMPTPSADVPKNNLPPQITPFIGRDEEVAELVRLLDHLKTRLVTILAPGGMGKTRLALEVGGKYEGVYPDGVYFVALAPLTSSDFIISTIADAVGFQFYSGSEPKQQLLDFLREKKLLLLIDNFEHLLDGAGIVSDMLTYAPYVKVLATSRERLNLSDEVVFTLSGMDFPDWQTAGDALTYAAVKLFVQSSRRAKPDFELSGDNLTYLSHICRLVTGMPLGIVLAAAWVEMLSLKEIAGEIEQSLDFLETEQRDVPERQRSIRGVFEYSWNRLSNDERAVFMKLSVFRGGFFREAAQAVAGAPLKMLASLVNKSLLRRDPDTGRYEVHELLRQYGEQQLEASGDSQSAHFAQVGYYAEWMGQQWVAIKNHGQVEALRSVEIEFENLRAAWFGCVEQDRPAELHKMVSSLWFYCEMRQKHNEALEWLRVAIEKFQSAPPQEVTNKLLGHLLARQGWFNTDKGLAEQGKALAEEGLAILTSLNAPEESIMAYVSLAWADFELVQYQETYQAAKAGLQLAQAANHTWGIGVSLYWLGLTELCLDNIATARTVGEESLKNTQAVGDIYFSACVSAFVVGGSAIRSKDYAEAKKWIQQSLSYYKQLDARWGIGTITQELGKIATSLGDFIEAKYYFAESLKMRRNNGVEAEILNCVIGIAEMWAAMGDKEHAAKLMAIVLDQPALTAKLRRWADDFSIQLQTELSPDIYAAIGERGKKLDLNIVVAELLSELDKA